MWQPKPSFVLFIVIAISLRACKAASGGGGGRPLVTAVTKDPSTSLYTAPLNAGRPLVLDLSGPTISFKCDVGKQAVTTRVTLSTNATDGSNPLFPVSFSAAASCGSPSGAGAVAGLGRSSLSFPSQVARSQKVANRFALCLPSDGDGVGVAIFGGGPLFLDRPAPERPAITDMTILSGEVPLRRPFNRDPAGYYVSASNGIAVDGARILGASGPFTVGLSTTTPYTELRRDVYRALITAFGRAMGRRNAKAMASPPTPPFELCYDSRKLMSSQVGYSVPEVDFMLEGGANWTVFSGNSMARVSRDTACFAFVEMKEGSPGAGKPLPAAAAVVIGGFQMEGRLVVLDDEKQTLSFTGPLPAKGFSCANFNFTMAA